MKYLKEYNSFKKCDRCGEITDITSQSMYNKQNICLYCKHLENTGEVTGDDLRNLDDVTVSFSGNSIFPTTTPSQMIYNL